MHGALTLTCSTRSTAQPGSVQRLYSGTSAIWQKRNIGEFVTAARLYGVAQHDLFEVDDLFEDNDMLRVMRSLSKLKQVVDAKL
jgi:hypothetical protein